MEPICDAEQRRVRATDLQSVPQQLEASGVDEIGAEDCADAAWRLSIPFDVHSVE
jgi:hypothetical protein